MFKFKVMLKSGGYIIMANDCSDAKQKIYNLMKRKTLVYQEEFEIIEMGLI